MADFAQGSQHGLWLVPETNWGETPATPAFEHVRHTTCSLGLKRTTIESKEVRPDRALADVRLGNYNVDGDIGFEMSFETFEKLLAALMGSDWAVAYNLTAQTINVTASTKKFARATGDFVADGVKVGDWIVTSGFTNGGNNGTFLVSAVSALEVTCATATGLSDESGGGDEAMTTLRTVLKQGTTVKSFTLMREFTDIAEFQVFTGCRVGKMSLSVKPNDIVVGTFSLVGKDMGDTEPAGATYGSATTGSTMDNFSAAAKEGGSAIALLTAIEANLDNGLEPIFVVGAKPAAAIIWKRSRAQGKATVMMEDQVMLSKFQDETASSMEFSMYDRNGEGYRLTMNNVVYTSGDNPLTGEGPIPIEMGFFALHDPTLTNMQWEKLPVYTP